MTTPDPHLRTRRASAGTLLTLEAGSRKRITESVDDSVDDVVLSATRSRSTLTKTALLVLLLGASRHMAAQSAQAIAHSRLMARAGARARIRVELGRLGIVLAPFLLHIGQSARPEDDAHAASSGASLASIWRALAVGRALQALRAGEPVAGAIESTRRPMAAPVARTAVTETAQAYGDEHGAALEAMASHDPSLRAALTESRVVRQWSALLDACPRCWDMDGETTPIGQAFRGGNEPGFMHPRCRCIATWTTVANEVSEAA